MKTQKFLRINMTANMDKKQLYEGVKALVNNEKQNHLQLTQHKLFTLFSVSFQYFLFKSTKNPGSYIIRIEDPLLADRLAKRAKDPSTRKFMQALLLPRKLQYGRSSFYMDFFHVGSWNMTKNIPNEKLMGALVVRNTQKKPMNGSIDDIEEVDDVMSNLPENFFLSSLLESSPESITISYGELLEGVSEFNFDFIEKEKEKVLNGVKINEKLNWEE